MALRSVTPPDVEPLTEAEVWDHLRVPLLGSPAEPVDRDHIAALISEARAHLDGKDGYLQRCLVTQTWELLLDQFPTGTLRIPLPPLQSVVSVKYLDGAAELQTMGILDYAVDAASEPGWIAPGLNGWPATYNTLNAVIVRFTAGYPDDGNSPADLRANIPPPIKAAMKLMIGDLYGQRQAQIIGVSAMENPTVKRLLAPFRIWT